LINIIEGYIRDADTSNNMTLEVPKVAAPKVEAPKVAALKVDLGLLKCKNNFGIC
jgi:hypothetical protein